MNQNIKLELVLNSKPSESEDSMRNTLFTLTSLSVSERDQTHKFKQAHTPTHTHANTDTHTITHKHTPTHTNTYT